MLTKLRPVVLTAHKAALAYTAVTLVRAVINR